MANYECVSRTNYFHVKDTELFRKFMDTVIADDIHLWEEKDSNINIVFAFGCEGTIYGIPDENGNSRLNLFFEELQKHITDNDAVILRKPDTKSSVMLQDMHPLSLVLISSTLILMIWLYLKLEKCLGIRAFLHKWITRGGSGHGL